MKNRLICICLGLSVTACSNTGLLGMSESKRQNNDSALKLYSSQSHTPTTWQRTYAKQHATSKNINTYARGIMQDLLTNLQYVGSRTPVAVADFVYLNSDFNKSNLVGKQLAEAFSHEVHKLGIPVVDYKLTDYIRVSPNGSLALSKDFLELSGEIPMRYVLTGTLVEDREGTIVNARIVGIESKAIVASAQGMLPREVTDTLNIEFSNDGLSY